MWLKIVQWRMDIKRTAIVSCTQTHDLLKKLMEVVELFVLQQHLIQKTVSSCYYSFRGPILLSRSPFRRKTVVMSNLCISCSAMRMSSRSEMTSCRCSGKHIPGVGTSLVGFFKLNTWFIRSLLYIWVSRYLDR